MKPEEIKKRFLDREQIASLSEEESAKRYEEFMEVVPDVLYQSFKEMERGERLPNLTSDIAAKNEASHLSLWSKGSIMDIVSHLKNGDISDLEMQLTLQEFITKRIDIYTSEFLIGQYAVEKGQKKKEFDLENIGEVYMCVMMAKSPKLFRASKDFIHPVISVTKTGIELPSIIHTVYIELEKVLEYFRKNGYNEANKELVLWLAMIADINDPVVREAAEQSKELSSMYLEAKSLTADRKELLSMLAEKYENIWAHSENMQHFRAGKAEGEAIGRTQGRAEGEAIGEKHFAQLTNILLKEKAYDKLEKATTDKEYCENLFREYGIASKE